MPDISGKAVTERRRSRSWTVRAVGLLLVLQAAGYVALSIIMLLPYDWSISILPRQFGTMPISIILIPATILAVLSAIGFLFLSRAGWLLAMAMQGATLLACLTLYFANRPPAIFPVMVYCIVMAFYLNSFDVRVAFHGATVDYE